MRRTLERSSFVRSPLTWMVTGLRIALTLGALDSLRLMDQAWLASLRVPLKSVLINPTYTLEHVREAAAIRQLSASGSNSIFADAYAGQRIHLPPLMLAAAEFVLRQIPSEWGDPSLVVAVMILLLDFSIARLLERLTRNWLFHPGHKTEAALTLHHMDTKIRPALLHIFPVAAGSTNSFFSFATLPGIIAMVYYANPITILAASMDGCFQNLRVWLLLHALVAASSSSSEKRSIVWAALTLALATYLDIHCFVFVVPVAFFCCGRKPVGVLFDTFTAILHGLSLVLVGSEAFKSTYESTHLYTFQLENMQPSLTTLWYLGMQVFLRFRLYFSILLAGLPFLLVVPTTVRLYNYPDVLVRTNLSQLKRLLFILPSTRFD